MRWLTLFFLLIFVGCTSSSDTETPEGSDVDQAIAIPDPIEFDLEQILERGTLLVAVENNTIGYFSYKARPMGYQYELVTNFAAYLGVEFEIVVTKNIEEAFRLVNTGEVDVIAFALTVTPERKKRVLFADYQYTVRQVLVQKKPDNWRQMRLDHIENTMIRNQVDLIGKTVNLRYHSSYIDRIEHLSDEIGGEIQIVEEGEEFETEDLILKVSEGEFPYTVADEDIAKVNASYYPNIDIHTPVSFPTQIAWSVRLTSPQLRDKINTWQRKIKSEPTFNIIYNKYFESPRASARRYSSDFFSGVGGGISQYDDLIKQGAKKLGWDWRLLAAQAYQESKFDPNTKSWAGARGLMQVMPATGKQYGVSDLYDPAQNIAAATDHLLWLSAYWEKHIENISDRLAFILASYNVGLGHVIDARNLTEKYGGNSDVWFGGVDQYMLLKSKPKYYNDPVCEHGYARGSEPVKYCENIRLIYRDYRNLFEGEAETSDNGMDVEGIEVNSTDEQ